MTNKWDEVVSRNAPDSLIPLEDDAACDIDKIRDAMFQKQAVIGSG